MKFTILIATALLYSSSLIGQEEKKGYSSTEIQTILNQKAGSNGGYGAFSLGYSEIAGRDAMNIGFRGAWITNHKFALGFACNAFFSDDRTAGVDGLVNYLAGGYGGLLFEPIMKPMNQVHISFPIIIGVGGMSILEGYKNTDNWETNPHTSSESASFFIWEPGAELEFNMAKFFRLGLGVSYRITSDVKLSGIPSKAINGLNGHIIFKFGKF